MFNLDKDNMLGSIDAIYKQFEDVFEVAKGFSLPLSYRQAKNVVISGMGGSGLAGHVIKSLYWDKIKKPLTVMNGYGLPAYVDASTFYIASSYSGNTEETLISTQSAITKKAMVAGIAAGGKLKNILAKHNLPALIFDPKSNYCNQPRMGLGYSLASHLVVLKAAGIINFSQKEEDLIIKTAQKTQQFKGRAAGIAKKFFQKVPLIVAAEFLSGNAHILANQLNENAKNFSTYFLLSELHHHLLEGLANPAKNNRDLVFFLINSDFYGSDMKKRFEITKKILKQKNINFLEYKPTEKTQWGQVVELLLVGSYLSFYLGVANGVNPSLIPTVDYLKSEMKK